MLSLSLQVSDNNLILGQLAEIDMLTQDGDVNSVSERFFFCEHYLLNDNVKFDAFIVKLTIVSWPLNS